VVRDVTQGFVALWLRRCFRLRKIFSYCASKGKFVGIHVEGFSWSCARMGVSVVVAYLGGPTTTNCEGLMIRVSCDTKRAGLFRNCLF